MKHLIAKIGEAPWPHDLKKLYEKIQVVSKRLWVGK
jgi:hypothetical protein